MGTIITFLIQHNGGLVVHPLILWGRNWTLAAVILVWRFHVLLLSKFFLGFRNGNDSLVVELRFGTRIIVNIAQIISIMGIFTLN